MNKKVKCLYIIFLMVFLCACNKEDNTALTPTPQPTIAATATPEPTATMAPTATPTPSADLLAQWYVNSLERVQITDLDCYVDEADSMRNSNLLNQGLLTYDREGKIYFRQNGDIYVSEYNGNNKQLICRTGEDSIFDLQLSGEWLYYRTDKGAHRRVHIGSGEMEQLSGEHSGTFIVGGNKMCVHDSTGLYLMDLDGQNKELINDTPYTFMHMYSDEYGISPMSNMKLRSAGYILVFDDETTKVLKQRGRYPLIAGNYLCMSDPAVNGVKDATKCRFRVWNTKTNREVDLGSYVDQTIVSDGETIYYARTKYSNQIGMTWNGEELATNKMYAFFYRWSGEKAELFWVLDTENLWNIFITPKAIYAFPSVLEDGKLSYQLWYFDLETEETGRIY